MLDRLARSCAGRRQPRLGLALRSGEARDECPIDRSLYITEHSLSSSLALETVNHERGRKPDWVRRYGDAETSALPHLRREELPTLDVKWIRRNRVSDQLTTLPFLGAESSARLNNTTTLEQIFSANRAMMRWRSRSRVRSPAKFEESPPLSSEDVSGGIRKEIYRPTVRQSISGVAAETAWLEELVGLPVGVRWTGRSRLSTVNPSVPTGLACIETSRFFRTRAMAIRVEPTRTSRVVSGSEAKGVSKCMAHPYVQLADQREAEIMSFVLLHLG